MNHLTSYLPPADPLAELANGFIEQKDAAFCHKGRDRTNDKLIGVAKQSGNLSLAAQLKADRDRINRCSVSSPCAMLACPRCSAGFHRATCDATSDASREHLRDSKRNGLIAVRISAKADSWDVFPSAVTSTVSSFVQPLLVPALRKFKQIAGAHISLDISPTEETLDRLDHITIGHADSLPILDNARVHVHFHIIVATVNVKKSEVRTLVRRLLSYMEAHSAGLKFESHATCIENQEGKTSNPADSNPMRPDYVSLRKCIEYNNKLQVGTKREGHATTLTRILRSHLVGQPIHWDTGVYATKQDPTGKINDDLGRLRRLSDYMSSFVVATEAQQGYHEARAWAESIEHTLDEWAETLSERLALDRAYIKSHGRLELETLWSDTTGFDELTLASSRYVSALKLNDYRQQRRRKQALRHLMKWLLSVLRLRRKSIALDTAAMEPGLCRYMELLACVDRARQRLYQLCSKSLNSVALLDMIDSLEAANDVFPAWTPYDRPKNLRTRTWLEFVADMLFAAPPIHDDLDDRVTSVTAPEADRVFDVDEARAECTQSSSRITWQPSPPCIILDQLNIPQRRRCDEGRHPYGVAVDFQVPPAYLTPESATRLRDWQINLIGTMREQRVVKGQFPIGFGKKWLVTHLPVLMPTASVLIVTRYQMDAVTIFSELAYRGLDAQLVTKNGLVLTDCRILVCSHRRLGAVDGGQFNVVLTLAGQSYPPVSSECLTAIRCDQWTDLTESPYDPSKVFGPTLSRNCTGRPLSPTSL